VQIEKLKQTVEETLVLAEGTPSLDVVRDLAIRTRKLARAWSRPQAIGLFGPSQAGKSFLIGAVLAHELGSLQVRSRTQELDFLKEINPAKGVESTGVVTRFSAATPSLVAGEFYCQLLPLEGILESMATGFLVECTAPPPDPERVARCLRDAKFAPGPAAPPQFLEAWDAVWHSLVKKYQDRHPYLNELRADPLLGSGSYRQEVKTTAGFGALFSLFWGGAGYAADLDRLMATLLQGIDALLHAEGVEVELAHVRASSKEPSILDASCLNAIGRTARPISVHAVKQAGATQTNAVAIDPSVLAALIAEIRLPLLARPESLLAKADILDFPGGRALKGINGFGPAELNTGAFDNAIEVYKRGKLTFLFEQFSLDREITALLLCSPGPTKPEAIQLQTQVEHWLQIRYGSQTPEATEEIDEPSLFMALTKFDMSLGALRSDNAKERWESRIQEACIDFWARSYSSWVQNWGKKGRPFQNLYWIRNPYSDQMLTLKPGTADYEAVKKGFFEARAVERYMKNPAEKWSAVEGDDQDTGLPRSGVPLLCSALRNKVRVNLKARELSREAETVAHELSRVLRALAPSRDEAEERERRLSTARELTKDLEREMARRVSGSVFGEFVARAVVPQDELLAEVKKSLDVVLPMSVKASDKVKRLLVHVLKFWQRRALERMRESDLSVSLAAVEVYLREVLTSRELLPVLGNALFPYFSRKTIEAELLARTLRVKISDAMLGLFVTRTRRTPDAPIRLSYAETAGGETPEAVDWNDVSFEDQEGPKTERTPEIIFAGRSRFAHFTEQLGPFYLRNAGERVATGADDPKARAFLALLARAEQGFL
jgi:hypothetical protein